MLKSIWQWAFVPVRWSVWSQNNQIVAMMRTKCSLQTGVHYVPAKASVPAVLYVWGDVYIHLLPIHLGVLRMSSDLQESTLELNFEVPFPTSKKKFWALTGTGLSSALPLRHPWKTLNTQQKSKRRERKERRNKLADKPHTQHSSRRIYGIWNHNPITYKDKRKENVL